MMESRGSTNSGSIAEDELPSVWRRSEGSLCAPSTPRLPALIPGCTDKAFLHQRMASCKGQGVEIGSGFTALGHSDCQEHHRFQH